MPFLPLALQRLMRYEENLAQVVIEAIEPGPALQYQEDQSAGQVDFVREWGSTRHEFEVTTARDPFIESATAACESTSFGKLVPRHLCKRPWRIEVGRHVRVNRLARSLDRLLKPVEDSGLDAFITLQQGFRNQSVKALEQHGIQQGVIARFGPSDHHAINIALPIEAPDAKGAEVCLSVAPHTGIVIPDPDEVSRILQQCIQENFHKFGKTGATQSHLIVVVASSASGCMHSINQGAVPTVLHGVPELPTHVWAIANTWDRAIQVARGVQIEAGLMSLVWEDAPRDLLAVASAR